MPGPTPHNLDMKTISQSEFCKAALKMPDRASADQLVTEYARSRELVPDYVRWFIIQWTDKFQYDQAATARKLYEPAAPRTK
jgi:hypothetical protein